MRVYRRLQTIKAITFDLDDTLYDNRPVIARLESELTQWMTEHHPIFISRPLSWWKAFKQELAAKEPTLTHNVSLWRYEQLRRGLTQVGYSLEQALQAANDAMEVVSYWRSQFDVPKSSHDVLKELSEKYPLVAITNGNVNVDTIGLSGYFQAVFKSGFDGLAKPFPDLFAKAQKKLNLQSKHILHVGDALYSDVEGAKRAGFQACWINLTGTSLIHQPKATLLPDLEIEDISELRSLL
ncbi:5-amino-6-(5-phospho-D-ribitylamino)uracil phosphatase YigB [Vibrio marisflavi]|uniref:5-amino-6-(5-phospho-D-ribitylamino)uracil phosphatase YigB n=1 Tax=Vibrio marisflavi CECT 7928 TaxID=634439 RepID=A0ABN8E983_9VIBR|nr:5-amino-6-(5-phospho-D-ribitylamino)uracil phosphatase YigB [Vibrio marisflavi]CAH0542641.1 5-amino-6-(5-phospho-D-ribitylamino)uracil phosphatase YigB [Vibrio marisflavi CECT 7928]